jgi:prepilin-type N-terminal cleavage/methylation domain-containing protein
MKAMTHAPGVRGSWRDQRGFSLIEVAVTLLVTLVVLAGSFRAFDDARKAIELGTLVSDNTQSVRAAVVQITRDVMQTGRELPNAGIPVPSGTGSAAVRRPAPPGATLTFPTSWGVLPSVCTGQRLGPTINGVQTDIITVLYADPTLDLNQWPLTAVASNGSTMTVDSRTAINGATNGLRPGDLIWFTNAVGNAIQTVTGVNGQIVSFAADSSDAFGLNARSASQGTILQIRSGTTFPPTSATRVLMVSYYIDTVTAAGQMRLMRRVGFGAARLVGVGVENLQATYDIVDGTTNPTNQAEALSPNNPSQIRKLNLFVAEQSSSSFSATRQKLRSTVATQISMRSMSFVDRYR